MKVIELRFLDQTHHVYFKGRPRKVFKPGPRVRDDEIPGLDMSFNPNTGVISIDAPGESTAVHLSVCAPKFEPVIVDPSFTPEVVQVAAVPAPAPAPKGKKGKKAKAEAAAKKAELDNLHGYDTTGDDIPDADVAKYMQGPAKLPKASAPPPKKRVASSTVRVNAKAVPEVEE